MSFNVFFIFMIIISPNVKAASSYAEPCSQLLLGQAPIPAKLKGEEQIDLMKDVASGALLAQNSLMFKAWETTVPGFLAEDMDFDYVPFILNQIRGGLDINMRDPKGRTALMHAAASGYSRMMWALIRLGADVSLKDDNGQTASDLSMMLRDHEHLKTDMFYVQNYLSYRGYYIVDQVMEHFIQRNFNRLEKLFQKGVYVDTFDLAVGKSLLTYSSEINDLEMMDFLLEHGADPNFGNRAGVHHQYPILSATSSCHKDAVSLLMKHGGNLNAIGSYPYDINPIRQVIWDYVHKANDKCPKLEMLDWLLSQGADPNANLEYLPEHQRKTLDGFLNRFDRQQPELKLRRDQIEEILKSYDVKTDVL